MALLHSSSNCPSPWVKLVGVQASEASPSWFSKLAAVGLTSVSSPAVLIGAFELHTESHAQHGLHLGCRITRITVTPLSAVSWSILRKPKPLSSQANQGLSETCCCCMLCLCT